MEFRKLKMGDWGIQLNASRPPNQRLNSDLAHPVPFWLHSITVFAKPSPLNLPRWIKSAFTPPRAQGAGVELPHPRGSWRRPTVAVAVLSCVCIPRKLTADKGQ